MLRSLLSKYGIIFFSSYAGSFVFLVTVSQKVKTAGLPGDILIKQAGYTIYFPIASSLVLAVAITIGFEIFKALKR